MYIEYKAVVTWRINLFANQSELNINDLLDHVKREDIELTSLAKIKGLYPETELLVEDGEQIVSPLTTLGKPTVKLCDSDGRILYSNKIDGSDYLERKNKTNIHALADELSFLKEIENLFSEQRDFTTEVRHYVRKRIADELHSKVNSGELQPFVEGLTTIKIGEHLIRFTVDEGEINPYTLFIFEPDIVL